MNHSSPSRPRRLALVLAVSSAVIGPAVIHGSPVSARDDNIIGKITTDVRIIAEQNGWDVGATADHLAAQAGFAKLIDEVSLEFPKSFAGAEFAEKPGAQSLVMIKGTTPRVVAPT